ncbi:MAG: response regulator [Candidatus Omnitrophica bacterium]|nr:response regulator [Candidatus Omnitrophota bacterium]
MSDSLQQNNLGAGSRRLTVVALDDNPDDLELLRVYLKALPRWEIDFYPFHFDSPRSRLPPGDPDIIFIDHQLGMETGFSGLQKIRNSGIGSPVILITGHSDEKVAVEAIRAGVSDYIEKQSLSTEGLDRAITNSLEKQKLQVEIQRQREELQKSNRDLIRKNDQIRNFYHTISHELKTPLTSALEFISLTLEGQAGPVTATQKEYLEIAKDSCRQIGAHVNDLLDMTRLETGKLSVSPHPAQFEPVLLRILPMLLHQATEAELNLRCDIQPDLPNVMIDEEKVIRVLSNLVNNAVKFTRAGGEVKVSAGLVEVPAPCVEVCVRDTGRGIVAEELENIFDPLFQVRKSDTVTMGGLGLGLSICKEIVRQHGGEIRVESEWKKGSAFFFTLPVAGPEERMEILVVDDDELTQDAMKRVLEREGYRATTVEGGKKALQTLENFTPNLVLLDMHMPEMNGPRTLKEIKKYWPHLPVVIMTSNPRSELVEEALSLSPVTLLAKPCKRQQLLDTVRGILEPPEVHRKEV